jgi:glutathione S-transferase
MDNIRVWGFRNVPQFARGLVRDLRVRWALEEAGMRYAVDLIDVAERHSASYRARHPFGQVPSFDIDGGTMFESGAILYRIGNRSKELMPADERGRVDTVTWMFAALNTVEPPLAALSNIDNQNADQEWARLRRPAAVENVELRLGQLSDWLEGRDYLVGRFTVADILMTTVLNFIRHTDLIEKYPVLAAYKARCEARPAYRKALDAQLAEYAAHELEAA